MSNPLRYVDRDGNEAGEHYEYRTINGKKQLILFIETEDWTPYDPGENVIFYEISDEGLNEFGWWCLNCGDINNDGSFNSDDANERGTQIRTMNTVFWAICGCISFETIAGPIILAVVDIGTDLFYENTFNSVIEEMKEQEEVQLEIKSWYDRYIAALQYEGDDRRNKLLRITDDMEGYKGNPNTLQSEYIEKFYKFLLQECGIDSDNFKSLNCLD